MCAAGLFQSEQRSHSVAQTMHLSNEQANLTGNLCAKRTEAPLPRSECHMSLLSLFRNRKMRNHTP
jgi:hypothetical protein